MSAAKEMNWSAFLRNPKSIEALLKRGDVVLKRRDGPPLRLSRHLDERRNNDALAAVARLLAPMLSAVDVPAAGERLPWTRLLPEEERHAFLRGLLQRFEECADLGDIAPLNRFVAEWKSTALLYAEGHADRLQAPIAKVGDRVSPPPRR